MRATPDAALVTSAVAAVLLLLGLAHLVAPEPVPLAEAARREGARVAVEVLVLDVRQGARGAFLELADDAHRMGAFAPPGVAVARGDRVLALGVVTRLDAGLGLSLDTVEVVERAASVPLLPDELARTPASFDGARVLVAGEVRGDDLAGGGARVRLRGEPPPERAGAWMAEGVFGYREAEAAYVLWVDAWTRSSS